MVGAQRVTPHVAGEVQQGLPPKGGRPPRVAPRNEDPLRDEMGWIRGLDPFARETLRERATLALEDPDDEALAVEPLAPDRARQILDALYEDDIRRQARRAKTGEGDLDSYDLIGRLGGDPSRSSGRVPCPAHGGTGRDRNLGWKLRGDGKLILKCFSHDCSPQQILAAIGVFGR